MSNQLHYLRYLLGCVCFVLFTLPMFSQNENINTKIFTIKKGRHHASRLLKNRFLWHVEDLRWQTQFDTSARYILRNRDGTLDVDQYDWMKLPGITFTPWNPLKNTAMLGWRYNVKNDSIELIPYFHVSGKRFFTDNPHLTVGINEPFEHNIHLNYYKKEISVTIVTARGRLIEKRAYKTFRPWAFQIHPFFGGNKRAPRKITLSIKLDKTKRDRKLYKHQ